MVVDRFARDRLAETLEAYLAEEAPADDVFERLRGLERSTADETVRFLLRDLRGENDEFEPPPQEAEDLTKEDWDRLQRILLLLRSDAHLLAETRWRWDRSQLAAAAVVGLFAGGAYCFGLFEAWLPMAAACCWPAWHIQSHREAVERPADPRSAPFASRQEVAAVRRRVRGFRKRPFPGDRTPPPSPPWTWAERIVWVIQAAHALQCLVFAIVLIPVILTVQMLPIYATVRRVEWL